MPTEEWLVLWKRNRNNRGEAIVHSLTKAMNLAEEKKDLGYKISVKKLKTMKKK